MRLALASLMAAASLAPLAMAQTPPETPATPAPAAPAAAAPQPAPTAPAAPEAAPTTPSTAAPAAAPPPPTVPGTTPPGATPPAAAAPAETPPPAEAAPPAPPAPPTDPTAIALLKTLEDVCVPAAKAGDKDLGKYARGDKFRKSGDNWVLKGPGYQFTLLPPGSNPNDCQVQIVHAVDRDQPAKELVVALHNWAVFGHGWTLASNYKHTEDGSEYIVRSWEHAADSRNEALVLTTTRKADNSPESRSGDTSTLIYSNHPAS
ncbi:MAG TPA: hypothetical protein VH353_15810 [Caulobacteraceae bacterium]|nr:hypothetical protein [Caulobacteraceae bacterium]